jgi:glutamate racemase
MSDSRPIGIFDSGVGGLTVLRAMHDEIPDESTIYVGDLAHFPYGPKEPDEVRQRSCAIASYLETRQIKALVVACNTATSAALEDVEALMDVPVVGVVRPGAEEAVRRSPRHSIGVVATEGSVRSRAYDRAIAAVCPDCRVTEVALGELVDLVESGLGHMVETRALITETVDDLIEGHDCDTIVLGCTHFPLVRGEFERASAGRAKIVDSASSTVRRLHEVLEAADLLAPDGSAVDHEFLSTARRDAFVAQAQRLFGTHVRADVVDVPTLPESIVSAAV